MMIKKFFNSQSKTISSAAFILGIAALSSRLLGLFRDRLLAGKFGAGDELDMYYAAFRLPDLVFSILIMGAISSALIPVFTEHLTKNKKEAWRLINGFLNLSLLGLFIIISLLVIFAPQIISFIAPGFGTEKMATTVTLTRIMFLSPLLFGLGSIFGAVLQTFKRFLVFSLAPLVYNVGIIVGIFVFTPIWGIYGLAWAVVLGAVLHLLIQIPSAMLAGFRYQWVLGIYHKGVRKILRLMVPRTVGLAAYHINLIVITAIASTLVAGSVTIFNFANNLQYVPVGIFGISFATAAFPSLAHAYAQKKKAKLFEHFNSTFRTILFLIIPASVLVYLLRAQIVRVILGTGQFGWTETRLVAACLGLFSLSIFAQSLVPLLARTFYAMQNTRIPVIISIISIVFNIFLSFSLVMLIKTSVYFSSFLAYILKIEDLSRLEIIGLPLAFSLASILNLVMLFLALRNKTEIKMDKIFVFLLKIVTSTFIMAAIIYISLRLVAPLVNMRTFVGVLTQAITAGVAGIGAYILFTYLLGCKEVGVIKRLFKKS